MTKLKRIRKERGLSQSRLAEASGVNVRMIQHYEQGVKDMAAGTACPHRTYTPACPQNRRSAV